MDFSGLTDSPSAGMNAAADAAAARSNFITRYWIDRKISNFFEHF